MRAFRRLFEALALFLVLSLGLFYLLAAMPGASIDALLEQSGEVTPSDLARLRELRGENRSTIERYRCWLFGHGDRGPDDRCAYWPSEGLLKGDLGYSRVHRVAVGGLLTERFINTMRLVIPSLAIAALASAALGLLAASRRWRRLDRALEAIAFAGIASPAHWLAMLAIWIGAVQLGWFPAGGIDDPRSGGGLFQHALLPIAVLSFELTCHWSRFARASALEAIGQDHVRTARAKGLSEARILCLHVLPGALIPLITVIAQSLPGLLGGALVIERAFGYPGIGLLIFESVEGSDHLVAVVVFLALGIAASVATALADGLYRALDPRIGAAS